MSLSSSRFSKILVVSNPAAGNSEIDTIRRVLAQHLGGMDINYEIYETSSKVATASRVRGAIREGYELVVAAGGDGTVSQVVDGLFGSDIPLAILPLGTGNLLARELEIPLDVEKAVALLVRGGTLRTIDVLYDGDHAYVSHVSLGTYANLAETLDPERKHDLGRVAYVWRAFQELLRGKSWRFDLEIDGEEHHVRGSLVLVANVGEVGVLSLRWGPDIRVDDGRIQVCLVRGRTLGEYLRFLWHALHRQYGEAPRVSYLVAEERIVVKASRPLPVRGDGEIVGEREIEVRVVPGTLRVLVSNALEGLGACVCA